MGRHLEGCRFRTEQYRLRLKLHDPARQINEKRQLLADLEERMQDVMERRLLAARQELTADEQRMQQRMERKLLEAKHRLALAGGRLHGLSPLAKISKGFGFLTDQSEKRIESIKAVQPGDRITIRISDGELKAQVTGTRELGSNAGV